MMWLEVILLVVVVFVYQRWRRMTILRRNGIPGPSPNWLLGNAVEIFKKGMNVCFEEWKNQYGDIVGIYLGGTYHIVVTDVELLRKVQIVDHHLFSDRNHFIKGALWPSKLGMSNVFFSKGEDWTRQREIFNKSFTPSRLRDYVTTTTQRVEQQLEVFASLENQEIETTNEWMRLTMSIITKALLGIDVRGKAMDAITEFIKNVAMLPITSDFGFVYLLFPELEFVFFPIRKFLFSLKEYFGWNCLGQMFEIVRATMKERRNNPEKFQDGKLFLQRIMAEPSLTEDEKVSNGQFWLVAATDTTTNTLTFLGHTLTNNRDLQNELREEAREMLEKDGEIGYNASFGLPKILAFIDETIRMYPAAALAVTRVASTDYKFENSEGKLFTLPKGVGILIGTVSLHNDERYWESPKTFNPDRFLDGVKSLKEPLAYQAFGQGPRQCPGSRFASLVLKITIARLLLKYDVVATSKSEIGELKTVELFGTLVAKNGVYLKLVPRSD